MSNETNDVYVLLKHGVPSRKYYLNTYHTCFFGIILEKLIVGWL